MALLRHFLLSVFLLFSAASAQAEGQRVILVLDASGSMWGQIGGKAKLDIAKDVVGKVIGSWKPEDEIGLVAYGHRKKGACDDIETVIEPGAFDAGKFMSSVQALTPRGKTPMTQAVRQAAEALKYTEKQATVILVSDGIETCDPNPCAVAEELEKLGIGLTVHTVGFGLDDQGAVSQLKCLAEKTGGIAVLADNADDLEKALKTTVAATPAPPPAPAPAPEPVKAEFNFMGHVVMAEGVELPDGFNQPTWEFYQSVNGEPGDRRTVEYGSNVKINLAETGDYIVRIVADSAVMEFPTKIETGKPVKLDVSLEAGLVKFKGFMDDATPMTDAGTTWALQSSTGEYVTTKYGPEIAFMLNAGNHKMAMSLGQANMVADVVVKAGTIAEQKLSLGAGVIEASGLFSEGGQAVPEGATFELRKFEANLDGKFDAIETAYAAPSFFKVPAGKYKVAITKDYASVVVDAIVTAGQTTKLLGNLNAGYLAVSSPADSTVEIFKAEKDLAGNREQIGTEFYGTFNKAIGAGTYFVTAKRSDGTPLAEKEFVVKAGARTEGALP